MISRSNGQWPTDKIVRDLDPADLHKPAPPAPRTALDIARETCRKIGNSRGDLVSMMETEHNKGNDHA